jgi:hypothetical protein
MSEPAKYPSQRDKKVRVTDETLAQIKKLREARPYLTSDRVAIAYMFDHYLDADLMKLL